MSVKVKLTNVRLSFPSLTEKTSFSGATPKYEATFLINKDDTKNVEAVRKAIEQVNNEEFKGKLPASSIYGLQDGDEKDYDGYEGTYSIKAKNGKKRPLAFGKIARNGSLGVEETNELFYPGCYVNAQITVYGYNANGVKGISCNLDGIQFVADGEEFGGTSVSFDDIDDDDEL